MRLTRGARAPFVGRIDPGQPPERRPSRRERRRASRRRRERAAAAHADVAGMAGRTCRRGRDVARSRERRSGPNTYDAGKSRCRCSVPVSPLAAQGRAGAAWNGSSIGSLTRRSSATSPGAANARCSRPRIARGCRPPARTPRSRTPRTRRRSTARSVPVPHGRQRGRGPAPASRMIFATVTETTPLPEAVTPDPFLARDLADWPATRARGRCRRPVLDARDAAASRPRARGLGDLPAFTADLAREPFNQLLIARA
jgi:hypothetical protein